MLCLAHSINALCVCVMTGDCVFWAWISAIIQSDIDTILSWKWVKGTILTTLMSTTMNRIAFISIRCLLFSWTQKSKIKSLISLFMRYALLFLRFYNSPCILYAFFWFAYFALKNVFSDLPLLSPFHNNSWNMLALSLHLTFDITINAYLLMRVSMTINHTNQLFFISTNSKFLWYYYFWYWLWVKFG